MLSIFYRTIICTSFMLIMPIFIEIIGWQWKQPIDSIGWLTVLFFITETVTKPWGIITHISFYIYFLWSLSFTLRSAVIFFGILTMTILIGQTFKMWVKLQIKEPRPFIVWLEKIHHLPIEKLYTLEYKKREALIKDQLLTQKKIPMFLRKHWEKETDFSCPSGHAIFSSTWALLSVAILWPYRKKATIMILIFWAMIVMLSRIILGMHWPKDLVLAIISSWIMVMLAVWLIKKFCKLPTSIK